MAIHRRPVSPRRLLRCWLPGDMPRQKRPNGPIVERALPQLRSDTARPSSASTFSSRHSSAWDHSRPIARKLTRS